MTNANRAVFHRWLPPRRNEGINASHLSYAVLNRHHYQVIVKVHGVFASWGRSAVFSTATSISPSLRLRQRPSRYAVHARRNLPDKELRYLRTVIVTAAVYRCFGRQPRGEPLTDFLNIPAPSRRHSVYFLLRVCTELCF